MGSDFPQRKTVDCTRCQVCKVTTETESLYLTPEQFRFQYAFCLTHYVERVGTLPPRYQDNLEYEPYDMDE